MSVKSQELSPEERGRQALDFITSVRIGLDATPEYVRRVLDDMWDRRVQTSPRHYGTRFDRGLYRFYFNPFVSHIEPRQGEGAASIEIAKYHTDDTSRNPEPIGKISVYSDWSEDQNGQKLFRDGSARYYDTQIPYPGTKDFSLALQRGKELIVDMTSPIRF